MKLSNILISVFAAASMAAGVGVYRLSKANDKQIEDYGILGEEYSQLINELKAVKNELVDYRQLLREKEVYITALNKELRELKSSSTMSGDKVAASQQRYQVEAARPVVTQAKSDNDALLALANRIRSGDGINTFESNIREKFNDEDIDENWAYDYEENIRSLAAMDEDNRFDIQDLSCKTSACEVKLTANENNVMMLGTLFAKKLGEQSWREPGASVIFNHEVKDGVVSIMIGRGKDSFN
ncbi:MAG: hypothetical protein V2I33_02730 [Kangiellaceae bacterium]|jgi:hypothetical protein|nr:hypothetical protein [Kangiellaceae bacterium]